MNVYILFAIALSAITGMTEAPVARAATPKIVAQSGARHAIVALFPANRVMRRDYPRTFSHYIEPQTVSTDSWLTPANSPRAPATVR